MRPAASTLTTSGFAPLSLYRSLIAAAERIPLSLPQLAARVALANVFWKSGQSKLASPEITAQLFAMEYQVPLLPPEIAAPLATATELTGAVLLLLGLFTRAGALMLLGMVAVIQIFVYPGHWGEHLMWAGLLLLLVARGAGTLSFDALASRFWPSRA